jgi:hypothetical protein
MIIQVTKTVTTEIEISFPYVTFNEYLNTYYYNYKEASCIIIKEHSIEHYDSINCGLEYPEAKKEEAFKLMDSTILMITEALNK